MSGAFKLGGVAMPKTARALAHQMAKSAPALAFHAWVDQVGFGGQYVDDGLQGVDSVIAGRRRRQTVLHQAAVATPDSPTTKYLPLGKVATPQAFAKEPTGRQRPAWTVRVPRPPRGSWRRKKLLCPAST